MFLIAQTLAQGHFVFGNKNTWSTYKTVASPCCADRQRGVLGKQFEDCWSLLSDRKLPKEP